MWMSWLVVVIGGLIRGFQMVDLPSAYLYSTEARVHSDRWLPSVTSGDPTSKLFRSRTMFLPALTRASRFFPLQLPFFRFNYPRRVLKSLYVKRYIRWPKIPCWNFLPPVYLFTRTYLHLSLPSLYAYISIFISFYDRFSCLNASVLAVLIIVSFMNLSILIQRVFWIFVHSIV